MHRLQILTAALTFALSVSAQIQFNPVTAAGSCVPNSLVCEDLFGYHCNAEGTYSTLWPTAVGVICLNDEAVLPVATFPSCYDGTQEICTPVNATHAPCPATPSCNSTSYHVCNFNSEVMFTLPQPSDEFCNKTA
ncbi:MAG: hypothetical protein M1838_001205 [Thelocarpon superellum]|nr:MAG: hypothetical protein M1838_001205 [Thelocarpon superellum]